MKKTAAMLDFISDVVLAAVAVYVALTIVPQLFGVTVGVVKSGSMEPAIRTGSVSYVKEAKAEDVDVGDVLAFTVRAGDAKWLVTHRVVEIDEEAQTFTTKGDNNANNDFVPVPFEDVVGISVLSIPYLGYVVAAVDSHYPLAVALIFVLVAGCGAAADMLRDESGEDDHRKHGLEWIGHCQ